MKLTSLPRVALLAGGLAVASMTVTFAQDTSTPASGDSSGHHWHHDSVLTADEQAELKKDREQVFAANPDLKTEQKDLWDQGKTMKDASADDKKAFHEKMHAFMDKLDDAIEKVDANAAPLIAKLKAAHHHHDGGSDSSSGGSN